MKNENILITLCILFIIGITNAQQQVSVNEAKMPQ
jgi:hypothetical protein